MPRQSNGNYLQPANTAAGSGQTISSTAFNTLLTDLGTETTNSVDRGGRSAMTAALPMGGQKITGMADPALATDGATKNYVDTTTAAFFSTGDVKLTIKVTADTGWVLFDDGTIGSASSGASTRANADTQALFTLIFNNISDAYAPIFTSGGGATTRAGQTNAGTAWAANCRISLTKVLGRALGVAGAGSGLSARPLGAATGAETVVLSGSNLPGISIALTGTTSGYTPTVVNGGTPIAPGFGVSAAVPFTPSGGNNTFQTNGFSTLNGFASLSVSGATSNLGSNVPVSIVPPISFFNAMIKL